MMLMIRIAYIAEVHWIYTLYDLAKIRESQWMRQPCSANIINK